MGSQAHVVLKMVKVVTHKLHDNPVLFRHLLLQFHHFCPGRVELLLQGFDPTELFGLHNHCVVCTVHCIIRLRIRSNQLMPINWIYSLTDHRLYICHQMIKAGPDNTNQLTTNVDHRGVWPLVVMPVPLLCALFHLSCIVGRQGQTLQPMMSGHRTRRNEVVQGQTIKGTEHTPQTLDSLVDCLSQQIIPIGIIAGGPGVLDVVPHLETLEALHASVVDVLGIGNELGRRGRSVGSRHFNVEDRLMV